MMIRKSTLIIVMTISVFMMYGGCDGDGGGMMDEAPPGAEAPAGQSPECANCPCKYFDIEINEECYGGPLDAGFFSSLIRNDFQKVGMCSLFVFMEGNTGVTLSVAHFNPTEWRCGYSVPIDDRCGVVETTEAGGNFKSFFLDIDLNTAKTSCAPCLGQYAKELDKLVPVRDNNRPDVYQHLTCIPPIF